MVGSQRDLTNFVFQVYAFWNSVHKVLINLFFVLAVGALWLARSVVSTHHESLAISTFVGAESSVGFDLHDL